MRERDEGREAEASGDDAARTADPGHDAGAARTAHPETAALGEPPHAGPGEPDLAAAKTALRREIRARRRARRDAPGAAAARERDAAALARDGLALVRDRGAGTVALFESLPTEPPTHALAAALAAAGVRILLPTMLPDRDLTWHDTGHPRELGPTAVAAADVVFVPAIATDAAGGRLGQGGGSYDRALARRAPAALLVAVVHDDEVLSAVPTEPHDVPLHGRLTPTAGWTPAVQAPRTWDDGN